jgi:hypothetical protein
MIKPFLTAAAGEKQEANGSLLTPAHR